MNAYHITFTYPQPGTMTLIATDLDAAKAKLNEILNATEERVVVIKDVVNFRDVPELQAVLIAQDNDKKAMEAEFERIIAEAAKADEEAKARGDNFDLAQTNTIEDASENIDEPKTIN